MWLPQPIQDPDLLSLESNTSLDHFKHQQQQIHEEVNADWLEIIKNKSLDALGRRCLIGSNRLLWVLQLWELTSSSHPLVPPSLISPSIFLRGLQPWE